MAVNLLHNNLQLEKVDNLCGKTSLFDSTSYLSQHTIANVDRIWKEEQGKINRRVMHITYSKQLLLNTPTENTRYTKTVGHFTSLVVNVAYITPICVDVDAMESTSSEYLLVTI